VVSFADAKARLLAAASTLPATAPAVVRVSLPLTLISEANARGSWRGGANRAAKQRAVVGLVLRQCIAPALPCTVRLVRVAPRAFDGDNLQRAFKAVRDAVADWLGCDDGDPRVSWHYAQATGKPREHRVDITAEPRRWQIVETPTGTVVRITGLADTTTLGTLTIAGDS
jgi:hypothetical protein